MESPIHIPLSPLDNIMARYYAKFIVCLRVKSDQRPQEVYRYLQKSFSSTITQMPFLAGKVAMRVPDTQDSRRGRLEIRVPAHFDIERAPRLVFRDLTATMDYDDLMEAGLPEAELDGELLLPAAFQPDLSTGADILVAQANFVERGCLLGVGIYHPVTDGSGLNMIMKFWAEHCRALQNQETPSRQFEISAECLNRELLKEVWLEEGNSEVGKEHVDTSLEQFRLLGLDMVDIEKRPEEFTPAAPSVSYRTHLPVMETSIFYVSATAFSSLKAEVNRHPATKEHMISANDALMALLWRSIMSARFPPGRSTNANAQDAILDTTVDGRAQFSSALPPAYLGNVILIGTTYMPLTTLTDPSTELGLIAAGIRKSLEAITKSRVHSAFALASSIPDYTQLAFPFATFEGTELCATSLLQLPLFELDFGKSFGHNGRPESVRPPKAEFDAICRRCMVLPLRMHGGFEILISLVRKEMQRLLVDTEFTKYAKFSSH